MPPKRCAIYVRISTQEQNSSLQVSELTEFVRRRTGWVVHHIYEDKRTGTNGNRPQLKALLKAARLREIDIVLCWKLDRWFRSLKEIVVTLQELQELGIEFVSLKDNIDLTTSTGKLMMHIVAAFSEWEVSILKERVRSGLISARARGVTLGRPQIVTPEISDQVVALRNQGLSIRAIERTLNRAVSKTSIERILRARGCTKNGSNGGSGE
ncbi:MAG: recombinase family protein [Bdellovibrionales bacterium]